jgi:hypothetical protein
MTPDREAVALLNIGVEADEVRARLQKKGVSQEAARHAVVSAVKRVAMSPYESALALLSQGLDLGAVVACLRTNGLDAESAGIAARAAAEKIPARVQAVKQEVVVEVAGVAPPVAGRRVAVMCFLALQALPHAVALYWIVRDHAFMFTQTAAPLFVVSTLAVIAGIASVVTAGRERTFSTVSLAASIVLYGAWGLMGGRLPLGPQQVVPLSLGVLWCLLFVTAAAMFAVLSDAEA